MEHPARPATSCFVLDVLRKSTFIRSINPLKRLLSRGIRSKPERNDTWVPAFVERAIGGRLGSRPFFPVMAVQSLQGFGLVVLSYPFIDQWEKYKYIYIHIYEYVLYIHIHQTSQVLFVDLSLKSLSHDLLKRPVWNFNYQGGNWSPSHTPKSDPKGGCKAAKSGGA